MNKKQQPFFNPELSGFCSQMAMILHSGISPLEGITIMLEDSTSEQEKEILQKILDTLMETADFSLSLKETGLFPSYLVHMVQIGEETGTLDEVMSALGEHYEREDSIAKNIRNAVTYPMIMIGMMLMVILVLIINHTKFGMSMRAVSKDFETAQLMGIRINSVISVTFIIGSLLAAIGSLLYFTNYQSIVPLSGSLPGLRAFVAAVFGGIGSIPGAVVGAFLIGICESVIKGSDWSVFSDAFTFAILIVVLCVKPTGLFGEKVTDKV